MDFSAIAAILVLIAAMVIPIFLLFRTQAGEKAKAVRARCRCQKTIATLVADCLAQLTRTCTVRKCSDSQDAADAAIRAREEKARQEAEALAKAKQEEYDKWKDMFSVDEAGEEAESAVEEEGMLERFITYMKEHKVTVLEEIAAEFKLRVQDVIQRVQALERMGHVTGVIDDRGKFIYITTVEMEAVAKYVQRKGRVRISTLAMESNKLIDLQPKRKDISAADDDDSEKQGGAAAAPAMGTAAVKV